MLGTNDLHRSRTDKKEYRLLTLDNGLEVFIIHDTSKHSKEEESEDEEDDDDNSEDHSIHEEEELSASIDDDDDSQPHHTRGIGGCAVAMAVGVGSFDECQDNYPHGLAHLLEHMLFMGSEKYPTENAYDDHLSKNGGYSNAYTETERTIYCMIILIIDLLYTDREREMVLTTNQIYRL